jgi:thiosulfate/3-mercaptopyruvate sulfurtransferase
MRFAAFSAAVAVLALVQGCAPAVDQAKADKTAADKAEYPRPELLLEPSLLARPEIAKQFVVLDARARKAFDEKRVPAARWVDAPAWAKAFGSGKDAQAWGRRIGELGIDRDSKVVVYDGSSSKDAARIWWILRYWGATDARLLNGGWTGWTAARLPVEGGKPQTPAPRAFQAAPQSKRLATKGQLLASLNDKTLQIVDARSEAEFCGTDRQANKRAGAIPGARHLEWIDLLDKDTQRFKSADQLRRLFRQAGIELQRPTATHCQSGGRAAVMAFAMELMGAPSVSNYYASWGEWGNADDTPIVAAPCGATPTTR